MNWIDSILLSGITALEKMSADIKENKQRPPQPAPTMAEIADTARVWQARLVAFSAWIDAHPGEITAADDFLAFLEAQGVSWASDLEATVNAAPGALSAADKWLPTLIGILTAFQPVPTWQPGPGSYRGR